jgi:hypothetical protein
VIKRIISPACKPYGLEAELLEARAGWPEFFGEEVVKTRIKILAANTYTIFVPQFNEFMTAVHQ